MSRAGAALDPNPFGPLAESYDRTFTATDLGGVLRRAVQRRLAACFAAGDRVLELACGTGEDALFLARRGVRVDATDLSPAMVEQARRKAGEAGLGALVTVSALAIEQLGPAVEEEAPETTPFAGPYDGAFSDFGGLNCVADLGAAAQGLAARLRPGAPALLCLMGPAVPWEWAWYLARGRPGKAFRRLAPGGVLWRGQRIRYPRIGRTVKAFAPWFRVRRTGALGVFLPPTYAGAWAARHPRLLARLDRLERRLETAPLVASLADHYLLELERR